MIYRNTPCGCLPEDVKDLLPIITTRMHFGGVRHWFAAAHDLARWPPIAANKGAEAPTSLAISKVDKSAISRLVLARRLYQVLRRSLPTHRLQAAPAELRHFLIGCHGCP
jgi:hypothetical protein